MIISTVPGIAALDWSVMFCPLDFQYATPLLGWLLTLLWLFLFFFRLRRRWLRTLLFLRRALFFFRRRSSLGLRTLARGRGL